MKYIVHAFSWSENSGGTIFLHRLVHELNQLGEEAFLVQTGPIVPLGPRSWLRYWMRRRPMRTNPDFDTPVARRRDLTKDAVVVYGERVPGNPLGLKNVVRWLLYRPGLRHPYSFSPNEMFFAVGPLSDLPELTGGAPELSMWSINRTYRNENRPDRDGVAYIVRKGDQKPRIPETEAPDAICIDGMDHAEINDVFNRCHTFYSYDEATMYSQYAAICGCASVVVPGLFESFEDWLAENRLGQYGIAYGLDDIPRAMATRDKVLPLLEEKERMGRESVVRFVEMTKARFSRRD